MLGLNLGALVSIRILRGFRQYVLDMDFSGSHLQVISLLVFPPAVKLIVLYSES